MIPWTLLVILAGVWGYAGLYKPSGSAPPGNNSLNYADQSQWKVWLDSYYDKRTEKFFSYELDYPRDFDVYRGEQASGGILGIQPNVQIRFPEDAFLIPPTNFGEGFVSVSVGLPALANPESCYKHPYGQPMTATTTINGLEFRTATSTDVGAGQIYTSKIFRTIAYDRCYEIAETIHTGNIGNYPTGSVTEFDKDKAWSILDRIVNTFRLQQGQ